MTRFNVESPNVWEIFCNTEKKYCESAVMLGKRKSPNRRATDFTSEVIDFIKWCVQKGKKKICEGNSCFQNDFYRLIAEQTLWWKRAKHPCNSQGDKGTITTSVYSLAIWSCRSNAGQMGQCVVYIDGVQQKVHIFCASLLQLFVDRRGELETEWRRHLRWFCPSLCILLEELYKKISSTTPR